MKRLILAFFVALSLGGCAQLQTLGTLSDIATKSIANPVTKDDLYRIDAGITILVAGLNTYKKACVENLVDANCYANVAAIQVYTRQVPPYLAQLHRFVRQNDQVNAVVVYNQLSSLFNIVRNEATARGVKTGA
jgi:hypothetical protein